MVKSESVKKLISIICFSLATLIGAFLLFQIEPIVGKIVTPKYGGTASIWTICLLFFQLIVLAGYSLTFILTKFSPRIQISLYLCLLAISLWWSQIPAPCYWVQGSVENPIITLLIALAMHVAIPCILLSTISGVMQVWFALAKLGNPYPLYSVSNIGSIAALLLYPVLIEPNFTLAKTLGLWSSFYWLLAVCVILCAVIVWVKAQSTKVEILKEEASEPIKRKDVIAWIFFSTMGSVTLLSFSSYITSDISPTPLLWVMPLAIYLLTFVLVFGNLRFYNPALFLNTWMILCAVEPFCTRQSYILGLIVNLLLVFEICMICHGELAKRKPDFSKLATFYLAVAVGGVLGGILVGIIAPTIFNFDVERPLTLVVMGLFTVYELTIKRLLAQKKKRLAGVFIGVIASTVIIAGLVFILKDVVYRERNFYSSARVVKEKDCLVFYHGCVNHGQQYLDSVRADEPASPYWPPFTMLMAFVREDTHKAPLSIGGVGLGVGIMAVYAQPGDIIRYYELDPKVKRIAQKFFTYLSRSAAKISIDVGDGRALLSHLPPQNYDLLFIDAFNGDAIPVHLLTKEALSLYLNHLKLNGLLVFHTTNSWVDLPPVLGNLAHELNLASCEMIFAAGPSYVVMCRDPQRIGRLMSFAKDHRDRYPYIDVFNTPISSRIGVWTDDFANIFSVLRLR